MTTTAAILARGLGTRMRRRGASAPSDAAADAGVKGMIRIDRPFLDYILSGLADAGVRRVVLVVGPEHSLIRDHFTAHPPERVTVQYAEQLHPLGTADAVRAAADLIGEEPFLVLNADNLYPTSALRSLAAMEGAGTIAFSRDALVADGMVELERIRRFAVLELDNSDRVVSVLEKPGDSLNLASSRAAWVSMNLWRVTPALVQACRDVTRSERGEYELPQAVAHALAAGIEVRAVRQHGTVFDLSEQSDIPKVVARLRGVAVCP